MERGSMAFDVVVVGAGPAGLSAAIRLKQLSRDLSVAVLEKGSEVGAHILSGAIFETRALDELLPSWTKKQAPLYTEVAEERLYFLRSAAKAVRIPNAATPRTMHNHGNYITSLGDFCRWLAKQAEELEVEVLPGFAAAEVLYDRDGTVKGVVTGDMGLDVKGAQKDSFEPGVELSGKYTLFAEGPRGHLGKELIARFGLSRNAGTQHYALGIKELWQIDPERHQSGLVIHGAGWPLQEHRAQGGFFLYQLENHQAVVGLITDLNYSNPFVSPFEEFQRLKHHPLISRYLKGGTRVSYGARTITKGGFNALPKSSFSGGLLIGCDAGTLNFAKIKGIHTAMKSGMLAAETVVESLAEGDTGGKDLTNYGENFKRSWLFSELHGARNFGSAVHKFGFLFGGAFNFIDQSIFGGRLPLTLRDSVPDHQKLRPAAHCRAIEYPRPDGKLSFDISSSVFISNTAHEEDQPVHLRLEDTGIPLRVNLREYAAPEQRYCPAGVYEIVEEDNAPRLQINASNCLHCKACDIKDPTQNIIWVTPEGGGGPNYPNM